MSNRRIINVMFALALCAITLFTIVSCTHDNVEKNDGLTYKLETPRISLSENTVSWDAISRAEGYVVSVNGESKIVKNTTYTINVSEYGTYMISVKAFMTVLGERIFSESSNTVEYVCSKSYDVDVDDGEIKLKTPEIFADETTVAWDVIHYATNYRVIINDVICDEVKSNFYKLNVSQPGRYKVEVMAMSENDKYGSSDVSNSIILEISEPSVTTVVSVIDEPFNAKGDGITNDRAAIQAAIDYVSQSGGGIVVLNGNHTYVTSNLILKSNVTLKFEDGATIQQCHNVNEYVERDGEGYKQWIPAIGVNLPDDSIPWNHTWKYNYPFIYIPDNSRNVSIVGNGTIKMAWEDRSEMIRMSTIGCVNTKYIKFEGFTITEFNAYAVELFNSDYSLVDSIKINTPIGTCCDGIHVMSCHGVRVTSCDVRSGDDGITIGINNGMDAAKANSLFLKTTKIAPSYNIEIDNNYSYPEASDVKAFGFFLWSRDYQAGLLEDIEIRDVYVRDCIFRTIGVWSENVWGGVTRIVPMSEFVWENNSYTGGYIGYPGIYDCNYFTCANSITNGDFDYAGRAFWSLVGNAGVAVEDGNRIGYIKDFDVEDAKLYEGFSIEGEQEYELKLDVCTSGDACRLFVRDINTQETIAVKEVSNTEWQQIKFNFYIPKTANYQVGIERGDARQGWAKIDNVKMEGYIAPTTIFDEQISVEAVNGNAKELGTRFTTLDYGAITQVRVYAVAQERGTHTVRIWNAGNGNLIAGPYQWSFEEGSEGWKTFSLPEPVLIGPNCEYIVSVSVGEDGYYAKNTQILSTSIETCDIVCGTDAGVYSNVAGQMPENVAGTECYLRDVVIETYEQSVLCGQKASPNVYDGPFSSISKNKYNHLGAVIIANTDGFLTKIRCYASAQERGIHKVAVWNYETKTRIAGEYEWDFTATEGEGWYEYVLEKPIWIEKDSKYVVSVSGGDNLQVARGPLLSSDKTYGDITIVAGGGVYSDGVGVMPVHSWNSSNYMRDVCFVPSSIVSDSDELLKNNFVMNIELLRSINATTVSLENYDMVCSLVSRADTLLEKMSETAKDEIDSSILNYLNEVKTAIDVWDAMPYHPQSLMADLKPTELMHDGSENQHGLTIRANVDGYITAIRVYCEANESGKRKAYIWDHETKTAVASFETEITTTSEGWYQFDLPTAVAITANKLYVVSINCGTTGFCPKGTALTSDIVKENIQTVGGGVYATAPDTYPEDSWNWSNYLRDVCFVPASEIYDINEENAKAITKHIDELLAMGTVNAENKERMQIRYDLIESVLATLDDEVKNRIDADKLTAFEAKGQELDAYIYQSLMADLKPTELMYDGSENQHGLTIRANVDGYITAIRVYCEANESGKRKAYIWDHETKTAVASFETEITTTSEGWYQFDLPTPVAITANKLYVVSINCGSTGFCPRGTALTSDIVKENIQTVGGGVYATAPDTYPEDSWNWSNYLRDVCFATKTEYDALKTNA